MQTAHPVHFTACRAASPPRMQTRFCLHRGYFPGEDSLMTAFVQAACARPTMPVVVVSGAEDIVTPPEWAQELVGRVRAARKLAAPSLSSVLHAHEPPERDEARVTDLSSLHHADLPASQYVAWVCAAEAAHSASSEIIQHQQSLGVKLLACSNLSVAGIGGPGLKLGGS
jgi:hypothetical protein